MPTRKNTLINRKNLRFTRKGLLLAAVVALAATGVGTYVVTNSLAAGCVPSDAVWSTTSPTGSYYTNNGNYAFHANEWGAVSGSRQTTWVTNVGQWGVCAYQPNPPGNVKTYPEAQREVGQSIGSLSTAYVDVTYNVPDQGTWNASADLWVNGRAGDSGAKEVMFWTYTHYQQPAGSKIGTYYFGGDTWNVWVSGGTHPIYTFQRQHNDASTRIYMRAGLNWLVDHGYLRSSDTFTQFNWGFEIVGTGGATRNFTTTNFSWNVN